MREDGLGPPPSLVAQLVKNLPAMQETWDRILGLGRSPGEGDGYPLQYSNLENSLDGMVHGAAKIQTQLSYFHFVSLPRRCCSWSFNCCQNQADLILPLLEGSRGSTGKKPLDQSWILQQVGPVTAVDLGFVFHEMRGSNQRFLGVFSKLWV